jgi:hypothetical protein
MEAKIKTVNPKNLSTINKIQLAFELNSPYF